MRRCSTLIGGNRGGDFFGQWLAQLVFGGLFVLCFVTGTEAVISGADDFGITWEQPGWGDVETVRFQVAVWLAIVFFSVARFFTYIDQRIRLEGWEVKLRLQAVRAEPGGGVAVVTTLAMMFTSALLAAAPAPAPSGETIRPVLSSERLPWYDSAAGRVEPKLSWPDLHFVWVDRALQKVADWWHGFTGWFRWMNGWRIPGIGGFGNALAVGAVLLVLTLVLVLLLEMLRRYRPLLVGSKENVLIQPGTSARIEGLPAGVAWIAPTRSRKRAAAAPGDLAGAIVYLFAHQLVTLERLKQVRLIPGRTGRQLVRSVGDRELKRCVEPTLRLFEAVYYGHVPPSPAAFEAAWALGERFEQSLATERRDEPHPTAPTHLALLAATIAPGFGGGVDAGYGRMWTNSVNGTKVFADFLRERGHTVRSAPRLNDELQAWADVIVRFAPQPGPIPHAEADWYGRWLGLKPRSSARLHPSRLRRRGRILGRGSPTSQRRDRSNPSTHQ